MKTEKISQLFANTLQIFSACFPDDDTARQYDGNPGNFDDARKLHLSRYFLETLKEIPLLEHFDHVYNAALDVLEEIDGFDVYEKEMFVNHFMNENLPGA